MAEQLGEIANALKKFIDDQFIIAHLYDQVMSMKGFDEESLAVAFDYLMDHEKQVKGFMVKNNNLRRLWLEKFLKSQRWNFTCWLNVFMFLVE